MSKLGWICGGLLGIALLLLLALPFTDPDAEVINKDGTTTPLNK
jgi:hypothetical protein